MTILEAKELVVMAGKRLVESGLIARTWGNVSCRVSSSHFVITPSGRDYLSLTPEEIVEVSISDLSYSGTIKPSSEKGIHAEVYKLHSEANFVIHTHQSNASAASVLNLNSINVADDFPYLNGEVICADYGLPGTKKLRKGVTSAVIRSKGNAVIMRNHGALCFGSNYQEAFLVAQSLENACRQFLLKQHVKIGSNFETDPMKAGCLAISHYLNKAIPLPDKNPHLPYESERKSKGFRMQIGDEIKDFRFNQFDHTVIKDTALMNEVKLHNQIYLDHQNINYILHTNTPGISAVSCTGMKMLPLLDDYAQIAGTAVKSTDMDTQKASKALKGASAVLIKNDGAVCCGISKGDATAVAMVAEKNSNALISAALAGKIKYINHLDCVLMRFVYQKKYSKQVNKK